MTKIKSIIDGIHGKWQAKKIQTAPFVLKTYRDQRFLKRIDSLVIRRKLERRFASSQWLFDSKSSVTVSPISSEFSFLRNKR